MRSASTMRSRAITDGDLVARCCSSRGSRPLGIGIPAFGPASIADLIQDIRAHITDPDVLALPPRLGSINQMLAVRDLEDGAGGWRAWYLRA
jgi:hypothetical protein